MIKLIHKKSLILFTFLLIPLVACGTSQDEAQKEYNEENVETERIVEAEPMPGTVAKGDAEEGKTVYRQKCEMCHGPEGKGDGPAAAALSPAPQDLSDTEYVSTLDDEYMFDIIKKGGVAVGKSAQMPPHPALSEEDVWNVISYIRQGF